MFFRVQLELEVTINLKRIIYKFFSLELIINKLFLTSENAKEKQQQDKN